MSEIYHEQVTKRCEHCGASLKEFWHSLTPGLVNDLISMLRVVKQKGINEVHLQRDMNLSKNQYNNFQKLRYHALIAKVKINGQHKKGFWLLTDRAGKFLRGEILIPKRVRTFRNKLVGYDQNGISINSFRGKVDEFQRDFDFDIIQGKVIPKIKQVLF